MPKLKAGQEPKSKVEVRLDAEALQSIDNHAAKTGLSRAMLLRTWIMERLEKEK